MPSFYSLTSGAVAQAQDVQQIIDALKGTASLGIPLSPTAVNDSVNFALAVKNQETTNSRALQVLRANNLVLLQADANGVVVSPDGVATASAPVVVAGAQTISGAKTFSGGITLGNWLTVSNTFGIQTPASTYGPINLSPNGVASLSVIGTASAVSNLQVSNAASGGNVLLQVLGTATGISFRNNANNNDNLLITDAGNVTVRGRVKLGGTALVAGDISLVGFGSTATVTSVTGTDSHGSFVVTCQGTGIGSNPTANLTYHDGTWGSAPFVVANIVDNSTVEALGLGVTSTATVATFTFQGTPVSGRQYTISWIALG